MFFSEHSVDSAKTLYLLTAHIFR